MLVYANEDGGCVEMFILNSLSKWNLSLVDQQEIKAILNFYSDIEFLIPSIDFKETIGN